MVVILKFINFIKKPVSPSNFSSIPIKDFIILLFALLAFSVPLYLILDYLGLDQFDHKGEEFLLNSNKFLIFMLAIVIAPIVEELIFRYHLNFKKSSIFIGFALSFILTYNLVVGMILASLYFIFTIIIIILKLKPNLKFYIYSSSTLFALIHIINYEGFDFMQYFYFVPLMVASQFFVGLVLSYIRIKYNIYNAILFHAVFNAVLILPVLFFYR